MGVKTFQEVEGQRLGFYPEMRDIIGVYNNEIILFVQSQHLQLQIFSYCNSLLQTAIAIAHLFLYLYHLHLAHGLLLQQCFYR